jgi:hypothetical protein
MGRNGRDRHREEQIRQDRNGPAGTGFTKRRFKMISMMLMVMSLYVFSRAMQEALSDANNKGMTVLWAITATIAVGGLLQSIIGSSPK